MQPRHFENLANLERQVIKQQFHKAYQRPPRPQREQFRPKKNAPITRPITALTGDRNLAFPYTSLASRVYPRPTEAQIREQRGKTAALVANDGLTPAQGGGTALLNELGALRPGPKRLRMTKKTQVK